jgi:hypothetical protein
MSFEFFYFVDPCFIYGCIYVLLVLMLAVALLYLRLYLCVLVLMSAVDARVYILVSVILMKATAVRAETLE